MSLFTTLAHRIQATPGLSTVYSWGQQAGTRLQPAYQDASQRVQQVSQQTRPVVDDVRQRVSSAGTYVVERVASQPREQIQTPQPQQAAQVAIVRTQPPAVVQSIQPCHQPGQQKPPLTLTSFVVGATKGAQDAGQRFGEKHPGAAKVVHAPLERMATTIQRDKQRTALHQVHGEEKAKGIEPSVISRTAYKVGTDVSGRIRQTGWESAEYYRKEMPVTGKYLAGIATVSTEAFSKVPEFIGMVPGGVEVMAKTTYEKRSVVPEAMAVGLHRATFGTAEEFIHHPVQTSADIGAFMVVGGAVKGGVGKAGRVGRGITQPRATAETPMTWIHRPSSVKTPTKVQQIKSTLGAKKQQVVDRIKPTSSATPEYTVQKIGGKEVLAPAPRSLYDRTYHSVERKVGRVGAVAVTTKHAVSGFRPPRIQIVKTVKGFKSAETTTPSTTASSVKPVHKTRIAINKDFPPGKQDISGTYDVSFKQKVATKRHAERTKGTGQQDIQEFTTPETTVETFVRARGQQVMSRLEPKPTQYVSKTVAGKETLSINQPIYSRIHSGVERVAGKVKPPKPTQPAYEPKTIGGKEVLVVEQFSKHRQIYNKIYSGIENKVSDIGNIKLVPEKTGYSSKITPEKSVTPVSKRQQVMDKLQVMDRLRPKPTPFTLKTIGGKDVFVQEQPMYSKIYSGVESILSRTHKTKQSATMPDQLSSIKTVETSKTKLIKDKSFESSGDWVKGKYLSKDKSARAIEVGGGKQPTFKETISAKGQLIAGKIAEKIPLRKSKASGDRTITLQEVKDKTMGSPQQKESGMFGSDQLTIAKQKSTSALKHKGEVVSQVKDVSLNVNLAPAFSTFAATSSSAFASTIKAGAISHGYDGSDYDYSSVYPSSAFAPAEIRSQEATGFENIQATSIVPIAATWQPTTIVPVVMQKPVSHAVHEVVPVQRTQVGNVPSYVNATSHFNTQVPRTEIIPVQRENQVTRHDELYKTDTAYKTDTVLAPSFMPVGEMPPIEIPIFGKSDDGFLKKKKKKKGKVAPQKQHKVRAWYPAALESVTAEQFQTGGKLTPHIAPAKTTRDLMREFIQTGRGIPTAKQHKARGN